MAMGEYCGWYRYRALSRVRCSRGLVCFFLPPFLMPDVRRSSVCYCRSVALYSKQNMHVISTPTQNKVIVVACCSSCPFVVVCLNAWRCGLPPNMPRAVAVVLLLARDIINGVVYSRVLGACRAATDWIVVMTSNENSNNESSSVRQQQ